jgi:signal transduction histidine kinase
VTTATAPGSYRKDVTTAGIRDRVVQYAEPMLRGIRRDLFRFPVQPLPPLRRFRRLRWLPHVAVTIYAVLLAVANGNVIFEQHSVSRAFAALLAAAQAVPMVLALYRPMAAWWMALAATVAVAVATFPPPTVPDAQWPWTGPGLQAYLTVLVIVALRVPFRVIVEMWVLTLLVGGALVLLAQEGTFVRENAPLMAVLSATALVLATAIRGRSEAQRRLERQEQLTEAERNRRALLQERTRIARELHDVVAHHMSVIAIQAEAAPYRVADPPEELTRSFATIRENAVQALTELRRVLGVLRAEEPDPDHANAPQPALDRLTELVANVRAAGATVETSVVGAPRALPHGMQLSAFRILQEAMSNALRHAPGATIRVEVSYVPTGVRLHVINDPPAEQPAHPVNTGHGVLGMRERAAMLGGRLTAGPTSAGGYEVTAFLPVDEREVE